MTQRRSTRAVHGGREDFHELGVHAPPIDLSSTYPFPDLDEATASLEALAEGAATAGTPIYSRLHNPTVARFERALAELEGAEEAVAFGSGMAAVTAVLLAARERGSHVVALRPIYGGTDHLLTSGLLGMRVTWATPETVAAAITRETALVLMETPANPTMTMADITAVVDAAGAVPVLVDSTFATPILQQPLRHGAAFALHSATKFLGGHGDVLGGVVATSAEHAAALRRVRIVTGGVLHPLAGYLLHRGLPTLPVRVLAQQENARILAGRLVDHEAVREVAYPGLPGQDPLGLVGRQMEGPGSLMAFRIHGGHEAAREVLRRVKLITPAVSLGSVDSLIQQPAGLTHHIMDPEAREATGIGPDLLRLSVGLEDAEDLWEDLDQALTTAVAAQLAATAG